MWNYDKMFDNKNPKRKIEENGGNNRANFAESSSMYIHICYKYINII